MSDRTPLMPKATAVWLVDNTSLTFNQIAEFCGLHVLEVKGIADGDVAQGIRGLDPISRGQITREEIERGVKNPDHKLKVAVAGVEIPEIRRKRYTPLSLRQEKPNAVLWLLRNHPELKDSQIIRLVGTTKQTIAQVRDRSHWNSANLAPNDPVTLGISSQIDLDAEVKKAARRIDRERKANGEVDDKAGTLLPTEQTTAQPMAQIISPKTVEHIETEAEEEARIFARLKGMTGPKDEVETEDESEDEVEVEAQAEGEPEVEEETDDEGEVEALDETEDETEAQDEAENEDEAEDEEAAESDSEDEDEDKK